MQKKLEESKKLHSLGFNCAQSVAIPFCEELGVDPKIISAAAEGFGAGMGGRNEACGALSGAVMIAGLKNSDRSLDAPSSKMKTYQAANILCEKFKAECGSTICKVIKGENGEAPLKSCEDCIALGIKLASELLK